MSGTRLVHVLNFFDEPYDPDTTATLPGVGPTADRPPSPAVGDQYFDTTIGLPFWWNGTAWISPGGSGNSVGPPGTIQIAGSTAGSFAAGNGRGYRGFDCWPANGTGTLSRRREYRRRLQKERRLMT